jgi:hypothetical protein
MNSKFFFFDSKFILIILNFNFFNFYLLGVQIPENSLNPGSLGITFIQVTYFLFAFVLPLFFLITLGILWMVPLKLEIQRVLFTAAEILNAWSTIDVFVVSIVAALLEIRQFA